MRRRLPEMYVWESLFHSFFCKADVSESRDAFSVIVSFFN
jgi:hypothetical protein